MPVPAFDAMQPAEVRPCPAGASLFTELQRHAATDPQLAFTCFSALKTRAQREHVLRVAWFAAVRKDRALAVRMLPEALNQPWVGETGFVAATELASAILESNPAAAERLVLAATRYQPSVALRSYRDYSDQFPFAARVLDQAIALEPAEAGGIALSSTRTGQILRDQLERSSLAWAARLLKVVDRNDLDRPTKMRVAAMAPILDRVPTQDAVKAAGSSLSYFRMLLVHRNEPPAIRRALEEFSQRTMVELRQTGARSADMPQYSASELYFLITYGRSEINKESFTAAFDLLLPKLKGSQLLPLIDGDGSEGLRTFLDAVLTYHRADALNGTLRPAERAPLWARVMRGIGGAPNRLGELIRAAEIADRVMQPEYLNAMAATLESEYPSEPGMYGLLAGRLAPRLPERASLAAIAKPYRGYFQEPRTLSSDKVFPSNGTSIHRYFFYNDDDGVESYQVFRRNYEHAAGWKIIDHGTWIHITGSLRGKRIEMFANVPVDAVRGAAGGDSGAGDSQLIVGREMRKRGLEPNIVVHRGHAYHLERTIEFLTPAAQLVYLGSCWGMESVDQVMHRAWGAQLIATRGTGSHTINDPLLKALNEEFLRGTPVIEWPRFWSAQSARLGRSPLFQDYVPPHQNTAAILLNAYYRYLAQPPE